MAEHKIVLDCSVAIFWLTKPKAKPKETSYAFSLLESLHVNTEAIISNLWEYEMSNVLATLVRNGYHSCLEINTYLHQLERLKLKPPSKKEQIKQRFWLANEYQISGYDAAYLEVAIAERCGIASFDKKLNRIAQKALKSHHIETESIFQG